MEKKKDNRGGARRKVDPTKGPSISEKVMLYAHQREYIKTMYGGLSKGIQTLIDRDIAKNIADG